jgi:hypothetical protein
MKAINLILTKNVPTMNEKEPGTSFLLCSNDALELHGSDPTRKVTFVDHTFSETIDLLFQLLHLESLSVGQKRIDALTFSQIDCTKKIETIKKCLSEKTEITNENLSRGVKNYQKVSSILLKKCLLQKPHFYYSKPLETHFRNHFYQKMVPEKRSRTNFIFPMSPVQHMAFARSIIQSWFDRLATLFDPTDKNVYCDPELIPYLSLLAALRGCEMKNILSCSSVMSTVEVARVSAAEFLTQPEKYVFKPMFMA